MNITQHLTDGGLPDGWTIQTLDWLAQAHIRHATCRQDSAAGFARAHWHLRWAALLTDILETRHGESYRV